MVVKAGGADIGNYYLTNNNNSSATNPLNTSANYNVQSVAGTGRIDQRTLNLAVTSAATNIDKPYDTNPNVTTALSFGTAAADHVSYVSGSDVLLRDDTSTTATDTANITLTGVYGAVGSNLVTGSALTGKDVYRDAQGTVVLNGKPITITATINGADAPNYVLAGSTAASPQTVQLAGATGTIRPLSLTATLGGPVTKVYDGTPNVTSTGLTTAAAGANLSGVLGNDSVGINTTNLSGTYNSADVATANTINYSGITLTGNDSGNYDLTSANATGNGSITPRLLDQSAFTITDTGSRTKTYDGTPSYTPGAVTFSIGTAGRHDGQRSGFDGCRQAFVCPGRGDAGGVRGREPRGDRGCHRFRPFDCCDGDRILCRAQRRGNDELYHRHIEYYI